MIKIERLPAPPELTEEVKQRLTEDFKSNNQKRVWDKPYIRKKLLEMTNSKCSYCEEKIDQGCVEVHIDHYHDKSSYPDEVVDWNNLLPSCAHCNKAKHNHDTYKEPIIDPTKADPREIFYIKNYWYCSYDIDQNSLGNISIDVLDLNDIDKKVFPRFKIGTDINQKISLLYDYADENIIIDIKKRNKILNGCRNILNLCIRTACFGASNATVLQENEKYQSLRRLLINNRLWNEEMENLHKESKEICLLKNR